MNKIKKLLRKQGFTLVELIIVIAIIAVLAVAAFMMLTKWLGKSRDSRRIGDMATIKKALEVSYSDTDNGLNIYPDPTSTEDVLDGSGVVMWNQGVFGVDTIEDMDNMQKAPQDPGDKSYYKYAITLDKKEFQLGTVLEDGSDVSIVGSVFAAAAGEVRLDGNFDGYVSYPTTGGTMIFKTPSLLVKGEKKINIFSGGVTNLMLNGKEEGAEIELRSIKTDENTSAEQIADALGVDAGVAAVILKNETGAVVEVVKKEEETPSTPSCDDNYSWDGSECVVDTQTANCSGEIPTNARASTSVGYTQIWDGNVWTPSLSWTEGTEVCGFLCDTSDSINSNRYYWNGTSCVKLLSPDNFTLASKTSDSITLQWSTVVGVENYMLKNMTDDGARKNNGMNTTYTFTSLTPGKTYNIAIAPIRMYNDIQINGPTKFLTITTCNANYGWNGTSCEYLYTNNLIAYFDMQTTESGKLKDFSLYGNHATIYGGVSAGGVTGKVGNAMQFDGTDDYVSFSIDRLNNNFGTISYFVKPVGWNGGDSSYQGTFQTEIPGTRSNAPGQMMILDQWDSNYLYFRINHDTGCCGDVGLLTSGLWVNNTWKHITVTWDKDDGTQYVYINGSVAGSLTGRTNFPTVDLANTGYIGIGHDRFYNGVIDEVRIYDYALSSTEVANLYNSLN